MGHVAPYISQPNKKKVGHETILRIRDMIAPYISLPNKKVGHETSLADPGLFARSGSKSVRYGTLYGTFYLSNKNLKNFEICIQIVLSSLKRGEMSRNYFLKLLSL
jgi:hypothetical protein